MMTKYGQNWVISILGYKCYKCHMLMVSLSGLFMYTPIYIYIYIYSSLLSWSLTCTAHVNG